MCCCDLLLCIENAMLLVFRCLAPRKLNQRLTSTATIALFAPLSHTGRAHATSAQPFARAPSSRQLSCSCPRTLSSAPQLQPRYPRHSAGEVNPSGGADLAPHQLLANTASLEAALAETTSSEEEFMGPSSLRLRGSAQLRLRDGVLRATNPAFL